MIWKPAGPYGIISDCGLYTISQNMTKGGAVVFLAYCRSKGPIAREECDDIGSERAAASARIKQACVAHSKEGTNER